MMDPTYEDNDPAQTPANIFRVQDPFWQNGLPPGGGLEVVPQVVTVAGQIGLAGQVYSDN